jgi:hypothetical protein
MRNGTIAALLVVAILAGAGVGYFIGVNGAPNTSSKSSFGTSFDTTFTTNFYYPISINYSGSWNLVYWGTSGTATQYNVRGNLNGSGNYETTIVTYGVGYVENTLCAKATKLDSQSNLTLTLTIGNGPDSSVNSTTASNPSAEVCATYGV